MSVALNFGLSQSLSLSTSVPLSFCTSQLLSLSASVPLNFCRSQLLSSQLLSFSTCDPLSSFPSEFFPLSIPSPVNFCPYQCHPLSMSYLQYILLSIPFSFYVFPTRPFLKSSILKVILSQYLLLSMYSSSISSPLNVPPFQCLFQSSQQVLSRVFDHNLGIVLVYF